MLADKGLVARSLPTAHWKKDAEFVQEVQRWWIETVWLTSTHKMVSGTQLLQRGWTLHSSGVDQGGQKQVGVGVILAAQLRPQFVGVDSGKQERHFPVFWG